jgi:hypothetical protein
MLARASCAQVEHDHVVLVEIGGRTALRYSHPLRLGEPRRVYRRSIDDALQG